MEIISIIVLESYELMEAISILLESYELMEAISTVLESYELMEINYIVL